MTFFQNRQSIGGGIAGMNNHGQTAFVGGLNVFGEAAVLPCQIAFCTSNNPSPFRLCRRLFGCFAASTISETVNSSASWLSGVDAYGAVNLFIGLGNVEDFGETLFAYADGKRLFDALLSHIGEHFRQAVAQAFEIEMECESIKCMILKREGNAVAAQFRSQLAFNQGFRLKAALVFGKCQSDTFRAVGGSTGRVIQTTLVGRKRLG